MSKQSDAEKRLRPDFRICTDDAIEIDCGLLHRMRGHTANVAGVGEEVVGKFNAGGVDGGAHESRSAVLGFAVPIGLDDRRQAGVRSRGPWGPPPAQAALRRLLPGEAAPSASKHVRHG